MKPKLSLLGWISFSLSVCELVTMSMPRAGLTGLTQHSFIQCSTWIRMFLGLLDPDPDRHYFVRIRIRILPSQAKKVNKNLVFYTGSFHQQAKKVNKNRDFSF
jgi:hypothetical protein